ncbi:MAG: hypothetical protein P4L33_18080 [Capsulimonadaceae bacterium]|nr:hypothetical protein [Capsulimonadaceae bacterium]
MSRTHIDLLLIVLLALWVVPVHAEPLDLRQHLLTDPDLIVDGTLDQRYRTASTGRNNQVYTQTLEADVQHSISFHHVRQGTVFLQEMIETPPDQAGSTKTALRAGEAYVSYRLPIMTDTDSVVSVKVGQFPIAAGLTPVYDTHLQIMQTLYDQGLGVRLDPGIGVDGRFYGLLDYKATLTSGTGADRYTPDHRVVAFRLGHLFATDVGAFNVGGSLLSGKLPNTQVNPVTGFSPALPPSGYVTASSGYVTKTRIMGDCQWTYQRYTLRGEVMTGADDANTVYGYFAEGEYRFAQGLTAVVARKFWSYGLQDSTSADTAGGINVDYGNNLSLRTLYEERLDTPLSDGAHFSRIRHLFTVQALVRF